MSKDESGTKQVLLLAAGELFAEFGFNGVSTRTIAQKAGANIAAINYHFDGKEQLYQEALLYAFTKDKCPWGELLEQALAKTKAGTPVREALRESIHYKLMAELGGDQPIWQFKLIMRSLLEPSSSLKTLTDEQLRPEFNRCLEVAEVWNPELSQEEAELWTNMLFSHGLLYSLAKTVLLDFRGWEDYPESYLATIADNGSLVLAAALQPKKLEAFLDAEY